MPAPEADAVVLHRVVSLSITAAADTLGAEEATVASLLHTFDRRLTGNGAEALRACWAAASRGTRHRHFSPGRLAPPART
ncbi:hypothetical protein ACH4SK_44150 [Streptomyces inhibens]|uniref:hypothetical protein n=1 Tax=Streptomyces inhibens TaxID=2293571 RepID=UPI00379233B5